MKARSFAGLGVTMLLLAYFASVAWARASVDNAHVTVVDCEQVQTAVANQGQYENANAAVGKKATRPRTSSRASASRSPR